MSENWLVIGICGVTCGGKTTLATQLNNVLPNSTVISQDDYFLDVNDPRQTVIPELNHINFELLTSLDMAKMHSDICTILANRRNNLKKALELKKNFASDLDIEKVVLERVAEANLRILILEGFSIFNYKPVESLCDLKYYVTLSKAQCKARRKKRVYEPPDCPGYFEKCVWPEYLKLYEDVRKNVENVEYFNERSGDRLKVVLSDVLDFIG